MRPVMLPWGAARLREAILPLQSFVGQLILGWGLFELIGGVIDHQILDAHYVQQVPNYTVYDLMSLPSEYSSVK